jgi:hypothetical protein
MTLRRAHGAGAGSLIRAETAPADELPAGVPADARPADPSDRGARGRFARGNTLAREGGKAKRGRSRLAARLGLAVLPDDSAFAPYRASASTFRRMQCAELARTVGGGVCGPAPSSIVASAALALAWSRYLSDVASATGDPDMATRAVRMADSSRTMLLTAHELCAREAESRAKVGAPVDAREAQQRMLSRLGLLPEGGR